MTTAGTKVPFCRDCRYYSRYGDVQYGTHLCFASQVVDVVTGMSEPADARRMRSGTGDHECGPEGRLFEVGRWP